MPPRLSTFRSRGIIPARRHDAFLLALLLAVLFNVGIFAAQAILPKLALLISLLGATPLPPPESEKEIPFILVDPALFEEPATDLPPDAFGSAPQEARQIAETPDIPEQGSAVVEQGQELPLFLPPGELAPPAPEGNAEENVQQPDSPAPDSPPPAEPVEQALRELEPLPEFEPLPEIEPVPEPSPEPEPLPEPYQPPAPELEAPPTEPIPEADASEPTEAEPAATEEPFDPVDDIVDLALLPVSPDGFLDPGVGELQRALERSAAIPPPQPEERPREERPEALPQPVPEARQPEPGRTRPQPVFKQIGGEPSRSGTAPRRQTTTSVKLLGEEASMRVLMHRYGAYMDKLGRQLQESLVRQMIINPLNYSRGQVKIRFGIAPDGTLSFFETVFAEDGMVAERILSERTLVEAAPFDPLTAEMAADPNFQNMTVVVHLL